MFILDYSFPSPTAPSNRIASLAKALNSKNISVIILSMAGTYRERYQPSETIDYASVLKSCPSLWNKNFFKRNYEKVIGIINSFFIVLSQNKKHKIDFIFLPPKKNLYNAILIFLCRMLGIKTLHERSEFPEIYIKSLMTKLSYLFYMKTILPMLDGMVVMTDTLKKYYSEHISLTAKIVKIPMSVDTDRFNIAKTEISTEKYIAYCGNISNKKDGVDILIKAFGLIAEEYKDYKLYIIGGSSDPNLIAELNILCGKLNLLGKVVFTGKISNEKMPEMLVNATVLALARPSSMQAQGGFPTKLGEYLATRNPVVVTDVGEITIYLKDGESAFISVPDSAEAFALKLRECISDPEKAKIIGKKGFSVAMKNFDYKSEAEDFEMFLRNF